jgi:phosphoribosyl 1,2-cyclic phosphate phosphodiesterase
MKMTLMGTGTSHGVPMIGCSCAVCRSTDPRDTRFRCSAYITDPARILIDIGPEFRMMALKYRIQELDAVLLTHSHADHLHGMDDLRIFSHTQSSDSDPSNPRSMETEGDGIPIYANPSCLDDVRVRFDYVFKDVQLGGGKPKLDLEDNTCFKPGKPLVIQGLEILPVPLLHGSLDDSGYLLTERSPRDGKRHSIAYLTDLSSIPDESVALIQNNAGQLDHLVVDAIRVKPHATHFHFDGALALAERLAPRHTWFIHMTHDLSHVQVEEFTAAILPDYPGLLQIVRNGGSVGPSYDGLVLET